MAAPIEFRWNTFTHEYPAQAVLTVWKKKSKLPDEGAKKIELMKMLSEASMFLEPVFKTYLSAELDTLQKFLYKLKNQQRNWKWFNLLQKIHKCLRRANDIKLHELFKKMSSLCAIKDDFSDMEKLPSCKTIKFLLEKTVALSKLCACILEDSEYTFTVLVRGTLIKLFSWYKLLRKLSVQDKESKYYKMFKELPKCLSEWVKLDVACLKTRNKKIKKKLKPDTLDKMFGSVPRSSDTVENLRSLESSNKEDLYDSMEACSEIDLGEPIVTADNGSVIPKKKKKRKKKRLLCEDADNLVMVNKNKDAFDPIQESYEEKVSSLEDTGVAIATKKKKKKSKHTVDDGVGSKLGDSLQLQERMKAQPCAEHEELPIKVNKIIDDEESLITVETMVDNVVKKKKKKSDSSCIKISSYDNSEHKHILPEDKGHSLKEDGRKIKKIKMQNKTQVVTDIVASQNECIHAADDTNSLNTHDKKGKKKKCLPHMVEKNKMFSKDERKQEKRKHMNTDEIAMTTDDSPGVNTKKRKLSDSKNRSIVQCDEDEIDDIFSCLQ